MLRISSQISRVLIRLRISHLVLSLLDSKKIVLNLAVKLFQKTFEKFLSSNILYIILTFWQQKSHCKHQRGVSWREIQIKKRPKEILSFRLTDGKGNKSPLHIFFSFSISSMQTDGIHARKRQPIDESHSTHCTVLSPPNHNIYANWNAVHRLKSSKLTITHMTEVYLYAIYIAFWDKQKW